MLLDAFLQQCRDRPHALALTENGRQISYADLLRQARSIAAGLQARGIQPRQRVALHLERGIDAAIAIFGTLLAGAYYVPLDLKNPAARLAFIVRDADVHAVLGLGAAPAWVDNRLWFEFAACEDIEPKPVAVDGVALAAILYTSGSTGQPRGVALSHDAIEAFASWASELVNLTETDRIASAAPFFFDLSTFDLYAVLGAGASLHFVPARLTLAPARLSAWLQQNAITGWYTVPSLLAFIAYKGNLAQTPLTALRFLLFAGEVFPTPVLTKLMNSLPSVKMYNLFGPTETNVCCYWPVERSRLAANQAIPIGLPAAGCQLHIDETAGELWVRGPTLASGYWCEGRLQPFLNAQGWYATGDRASVEQGEYHFHGRLGRMLKCSGFRVEPAEIEAVVNALPGVRDCAVVGIDDPAAGQRPALALVLAEEINLTEIRQALREQLPPYMQPSRYQVLAKLPLLANGKLDYPQMRVLLQA